MQLCPRALLDSIGPPAMPDHNPRTTRILIAADAPLEALALEDMLRAAGHRHVRVTSDAREILPFLKKWPYGLLVLDMNVRPLNSFAVLEHLADPIRQRALAVMALVDAGDEATHDRALGLGVAEVLARPFVRSDVNRQVSGALASLTAHPAWSV